MFLGGPTPACGACGGTVFVFSSASSWHVLLGEVRRPGSTAGVRVIFIPGWGFPGGPSGFLIQRFVAGLPEATGVAGPRSSGGCSWYAENVFANTTQKSTARRPGSTAGVRVIFIPGWGFSGGPSGFLIQRLVAGLPGVTGVAGPRSGGGRSWYAENVFANTTQDSHTPEAGHHGWNKGHF